VSDRSGTAASKPPHMPGRDGWFRPSSVVGRGLLALPFFGSRESGGALRDAVPGSRAAVAGTAVEALPAQRLHKAPNLPLLSGGRRH
jgi:hypothetical protein